MTDRDEDERLDGLFEHAAGLEGDERRSMLEALSDADRLHVQGLLDALESAGDGFLTPIMSQDAIAAETVQPSLTKATSETSDEAGEPAARVGELVGGRFRIVRKHAEGDSANCSLHMTRS